ncbi:MAG TPA: hypothetical protein VMR89_06730 [Actinomycetota bacterium]|nr:hypothetical protein [Actinomycetota bacterium]
MEAGETPSGGLGAELDRIEAAVDAGDTDLRTLGFWRVVALIKRDDELIERYADQVGRIDAKGFRAGVRFRMPLWVGIALMLIAVGVGIVAVALALRAGANSEPDQVTAGVGLVIGAAAWAAGLHSLAHYLVGRAVGIRFTDLFVAFPPPPLPGLKTDYATYLRASPVARAWMHAAGALATKLAPFVALALAPAARAPGWAVGILLGLGIFQIVTDVVLSTKASDWKKVKRELAVATVRRRATG